QDAIRRDDPGLHGRGHRPHDRPGRAWRVRGRRHHVLALPRRRGAPARAHPAIAGEGLPAARPDRRVVHHRPRHRDAVRLRQSAHPGWVEVSRFTRTRKEAVMNMNLTLVMQAVAFALFIWFCYKFIWPPLTRAIETRQRQIAEGLQAGEEGRKNLASAEQ